MTSAWCTRRSTSTATATGSPKISAQAEKVLLELTISEDRSYREETRAKNRAAASGSKRDVADLVHDHERGPAEALELLLQPPRPLGRPQAEHPLVGRGERDAMPSPGGLDPQRDRQVGLAGPGWSEEHHVGGLTQEVELGEVSDLLTLHAALEREVEVVEGLHLGEPGSLDPGGPAVGLPRRHLLGKDLDQVLLVVPPLRPGLLGEGRSQLGHAWRLECAGQVRDLRGGAHVPTPASAS